MRFNLGGKALFAASVTVAAAMVANADTVSNGGGSSTWTTWNTSQLYGASTTSSYQGYYWNNFSADGNNPGSGMPNQANIGWVLTSGGTYAPGSGLTPMANPPGALPFLSNGNSVGTLPATDTMSNPIGNQAASGNDSPTDITFNSSNGGVMQAVLEGAFTGVKGGSPGILYFGYYTMTGGTPTLMPLFSSADPVGTTAPVLATAGSNYGFYVENVQGQGTSAQSSFMFYTDAAMNSATGSVPATAEQHFAVFDGGTSDYWIGAFGQPDCFGSSSGYTPENSPCADGWAFDYNDFVVQLMPAPEPASIGLGLMGGALVLVSVLFRRRSVVK